MMIEHLQLVCITLTSAFRSVFIFADTSSIVATGAHYPYNETYRIQLGLQADCIANNMVRWCLQMQRN